MKELVISLVVWISATTGYPIPDIDPPEVHVIPKAELILKRCILNELFRCVDSDLEAIYDSENNKIYLRDDFEIDNSYYHQRLVHELVHFFQINSRGKEKYRCLAEMERESYLVQKKWVDENNIKFDYDLLNIISLDCSI